MLQQEQKVYLINSLRSNDQKWYKFKALLIYIFIYYI